MNNIKIETRMCVVNDELGLFHCWEYYSKPLPESLLCHGAPAGIFSQLFGIVEFTDGVRRVDPTDIHFCDEQNQCISEMARQYKDRKTDILIKKCNELDEYGEYFKQNKDRRRIINDNNS